jgi:hypothetical protein
MHEGSEMPAGSHVGEAGPARLALRVLGRDGQEIGKDERPAERRGAPMLNRVLRQEQGELKYIGMVASERRSCGQRQVRLVPH